MNGGIGKFKITTKETGNHTWGGIMKVPHPNPKRKGEFLSYPFIKNYTVAALETFMFTSPSITGLGDYADDTAAAAGGVAVSGLYRTGSILKIRVS